MNPAWFSMVRNLVFAITIFSTCLLGYCHGRYQDIDRLGPIDSTLIILEAPKKACEYAEPFIVHVGIRNPFEDTLWIEEHAEWEGFDVIFTDVKANPLKRPPANALLVVF
ncbi:MAG: hypothetical protein V1784_06720 [bacterium]